MYITLSNGFAIRNEAHASFLIRVNKIIDLRRSDFTAFPIPTFMGHILSRIGEDRYENSVKKIAQELNVSVIALDHFIKQLIDNSENKEFKVTDTCSVVLPQYLLQHTSEKHQVLIYQEDGFNNSEPFGICRPSFPISANLMVTTNCTTDCIYCYANRKLHPILPTQKILDIIEELHSGGTVNLTLTGGDIFAHPDWQLILERVRDYGYKPFLSTKTPIKHEDLKFLRKLGYEEVQFSLDSIDEKVLEKLVKAKTNYFNEVKDFLYNCSCLGINILIRSVLTSLNASQEKISELYAFLSGYKCIKEWILTPAFFSPYKAKEYPSLEVNNEDLIYIHQLSKKDNLPFKIGLNKITEKGYELKRFKYVEDYVKYNQICAANTTSISILANGDCSVCEMLYDNPDYLLGNVTSLSIKEIWNSDKALQLYNIRQLDVPSDSACKECKVFSQCRNSYGKRVCYLDIAKTKHSKYYPDPRCPNGDNYNIIF